MIHQECNLSCNEKKFFFCKITRFVLSSIYYIIAPYDYTTVVQTLTFNATTTSVDVQVPIIDDNLREDDEMFFAFISNPSLPDLFLAPDRTSIIIEDFGDGKLVLVCKVQSIFPSFLLLITVTVDVFPHTGTHYAMLSILQFYKDILLHGSVYTP